MNLYNLAINNIFEFAIYKYSEILAIYKYRKIHRSHEIMGELIKLESIWI